MWFEVGTKQKDYTGTSFVKFQATNDLGSNVQDRLYFRVNKNPNNPELEVLKRIERRDLKILPRKKLRFFEYFRVKNGNGLMFEINLPDSDFEFQTEESIPTF